MYLCPSQDSWVLLVLLYHCSGCWGWNPALPSPGSPKSDALFGPKFDLQRSPSLSQGVRHLTKGRGTCWRLSWLFFPCKHFCGSPLSLRGSSLWPGGRDQTDTSWEGNLTFFFLTGKIYGLTDGGVCFQRRPCQGCNVLISCASPSCPHLPSHPGRFWNCGMNDRAGRDLCTGKWAPGCTRALDHGLGAFLLVHAFLATLVSLPTSMC